LPLFSTVIPTFNRANLLERAIESALSQEPRPQVIVVDDGSTDDTPGVLQKFGDQIEVFTQANRGPGAARNLGLSHCRGDYIAFLDSDDCFLPWSLKTYERVIQEHGSPAFVTGMPRLFQEESELAGVAESSLGVETFADYLASGDQWRWWGVSSFVIRRDALREAGGFCNEWINGEDADLALRLGVARGFVHVTSPSTFGYREHPAKLRAQQHRNLKGMLHLLEEERQGRYPGGNARRRERRRIITTFARPLSLGLLNIGDSAGGWALYRQTFGWNLSLARVRYLLGFPATAAMTRLRRREPGATT
jgi:cellulose synthase/poly-beta-1,6-N-acetylglucosamine synthase-like glycosyltransferase